VFDGLRIPIGRGFRCALFLNSIAKRLAVSFRRFVLDCWLRASRSPRPPSRPAAVAAAEEVGAAVALELAAAAVALELVAAVQAVAAVGVRAAVVQGFTG
jgi:hypothetical protein